MNKMNKSQALRMLVSEPNSESDENETISQPITTVPVNAPEPSLMQCLRSMTIEPYTTPDDETDEDENIPLSILCNPSRAKPADQEENDEELVTEQSVSSQIFNQSIQTGSEWTDTFDSNHEKVRRKRRNKNRQKKPRQKFQLIQFQRIFETEVFRTESEIDKKLRSINQCNCTVTHNQSRKCTMDRCQHEETHKMKQRNSKSRKHKPTYLWQTCRHSRPSSKSSTRML